PTTRRRRPVRRGAEAAADDAGCSSLPLPFSSLFPSSPRSCAPPRQPPRPLPSASQRQLVAPPHRPHPRASRPAAASSRSANPYFLISSSPLFCTSPRQKSASDAAAHEAVPGSSEQGTVTRSQPLAAGRRKRSGGTAAETESIEARTWASSSSLILAPSKPAGFLHFRSSASARNHTPIPFYGAAWLASDGRSIAI
ncbi:unnamed protein product, partial [Urochloa humidicola]